MRLYAPTNWGWAGENASRAFMAECPSVRHLSELYGGETAKVWLDVQVTAYFNQSPSKDATSSQNITTFVQTFSSEVASYKVSEVLLFFARLSSGHYKIGYTQFSTTAIGNAWKDFLKERSSAIARIESEENTKRVLREAEEAKKNAVSREEYEALEALPFCIYFTKSGEQYKSGICKKLGITFGVDIKNEVFADIKKKDLSYLYKLEEDGYIQIFDKKPTNQERHNGKTWKKSTT